MPRRLPSVLVVINSCDNRCWEISAFGYTGKQTSSIPRGEVWTNSEVQCLTSEWRSFKLEWIVSTKCPWATVITTVSWFICLFDPLHHTSFCPQLFTCVYWLSRQGVVVSFSSLKIKVNPCQSCWNQQYRHDIVRQIGKITFKFMTLVWIYVVSFGDRLIPSLFMIELLSKL